MILRKALPADIPLVWQIEKAWSYAPWGETALNTALTVPYLFFVLADRDVITAYAILNCQASEANLLTFAVHPGYQGRGLGFQLLQASLSTLFETNCQSVFLEVAITNQKAQHLYRKLGFEIIGIRKAFYPDPKGAIDALTLQLKRELFLNKRPVHEFPKGF